MVWDDLARDAEDENRKDREKYIGVYIGILAVLLAICSLGGSNATKDATVLNIKAANTWAFFQAKNMRRHVVRVQLDEMELRLATEQGLSPDGKAAIAAKIKSYKDQDQALTNGKEGLDDLFAQAKAMEAERDIAMRRDPYFDWGGALIQIAIVLASVAILTGGMAILWSSIGVALVGILMTLNGFTLAVALPLLG